MKKRLLIFSFIFTLILTSACSTNSNEGSTEEDPNTVLNQVLDNFDKVTSYETDYQISGSTIVYTEGKGLKEQNASATSHSKTYIKNQTEYQDIEGNDSYSYGKPFRTIICIDKSRLIQSISTFKLSDGGYYITDTGSYTDESYNKNPFHFITNDYINDTYRQFFTVSINKENNQITVSCSDPKGYQAAYNKEMKKEYPNYDPLLFVGTKTEKNELKKLEFVIKYDDSKIPTKYTSYQHVDYGNDLEDNRTASNTYKNINKITLDTDKIDSLMKKVFEDKTLKEGDKIDL